MGQEAFVHETACIDAPCHLGEGTRIWHFCHVMSGALLLLVMNFIGRGLGPTYVGAASDFFRASFPDNSLQIALYTLVPFYVLAIILFLALSRLIKRQEAAKKGAQP